MAEIKTMQESIITCDKCKHLQERLVKAEVPAFSGNYEVTGTRFYCAKFDKWYSLNTKVNDMKYNGCLEGEEK